MFVSTVLWLIHARDKASCNIEHASQFSVALAHRVSSLHDTVDS